MPPVENAGSDGATGHVPVMLAEVLAALGPLQGRVVVDATFGGGGYSRAFLAAGAATVIAIDRDPEAEARSRALRDDPRFVFHRGRFGDVARLVRAHGLDAVDAVVLDLGTSSFQLDDPARGFSWRGDGPLDMRMEASGPTAADLLASLDVPALARILREFGDEPQALRIARAIVRERARRPLRTTGELRDLVLRVKGRGTRSIDPATQTFQALRIAVNDETGELERALAGARAVLRPGGRLVVVSFHSGEDGLVKRWVNAHGGRAPAVSRHRPAVASAAPPAFAWLDRAARQPGSAECLANPRARSARLRAAVRLDDAACDEAEPEPLSSHPRIAA
jgi:16S rRNA (cytosine1402-N4)-methyltransferase